MKVLVIVADSVRADFLGCYDRGQGRSSVDSSVSRTPFIDQLAGQGVRFATVYSAAPWTVPSIASMLTGVWSHRLGLVKWEQPYPHWIPNLFDHFHDAGLPVASFVFDPAHLFFKCPEAQVVGSSQDTDRMLAWLGEHRGESGLVFLHYWWTHVPYLERRLPLPTWNLLCREMIKLLAELDSEARARNREKVIGLYALAIQRFSEHWLPLILEAARPDLLLLTSDHGESWGERMPEGRFPRDVFDLHGNHLFNEVVRIPWILYGPEVVPARVVTGQVRSVDMLPTVLDLAGIKTELNNQSSSQLAGRSLIPFLEEGLVPHDRTAFFCRNRDFVDSKVIPRVPEEVYVEFGCARGGLKVLQEWGRARVTAYDLESDPGECRPMVIEQDSDAGEFRPMVIEQDSDAGECRPMVIEPKEAEEVGLASGEDGLDAAGGPLGGVVAPGPAGINALRLELAEEQARATVGSHDAGDFARMQAQLRSLGYSG